MDPADELLERFNITDGLVFAVDIRPHEIVIDCAFSSLSAEGDWSSRPARIQLTDPSGCELAFQYPREVGLSHAGELGNIYSISASGPLHAAEFSISFSYGAIRVTRCVMSVEGIDWDDLEKRHPWLADDSEDETSSLDGCKGSEPSCHDLPDAVKATQQ